MLYDKTLSSITTFDTYYSKVVIELNVQYNITFIHVYLLLGMLMENMSICYKTIYIYIEKKSVNIANIHTIHILLTRTTAARNEVVLRYHKVRGLYFLAVVFCGDYNFSSLICIKSLVQSYHLLHNLYRNFLYIQIRIPYVPMNMLSVTFRFCKLFGYIFYNLRLPNIAKISDTIAVFSQ